MITNTQHIYNLKDLLIIVKTANGMQGLVKFQTGQSYPTLSGSRSNGKRFKTIGTAIRTLERLGYLNQTVWIEGYRVEGTEGKLSLVTYVFNTISQQWEFSSSFPTGIKAK